MGFDIAHAKEIFFKNKLDTTIRLFDWLWSLVVFSTIVDQLQEGLEESNVLADHCWYGFEADISSGSTSSSESTCNFGIFMGIVSWLLDMALLAYLFLPALREDRDRPRPSWLPPLLFVTNAVFFFLWLVDCFNLSIEYTVTCTTVRDYGKDCHKADNHSGAFAVVFFSWFSLLLWGIGTFRAYATWYGPGTERPIDDSHRRMNDDGFDPDDDIDDIEGAHSHRHLHHQHEMDMGIGTAYRTDLNTNNNSHDNNNNNLNANELRHAADLARAAGGDDDFGGVVPVAVDDRARI